jgi:glyoxylase-like metal-dependent hydrolase (beta-lactamase superfamily II)
MFLLFGDARAALIDTGATASSEYFPLRTVIDKLVTEWLARHPRADDPLLVQHSHSHGDHVAGDGQFADRPRTTVVDARLARVAHYLGLTGRRGSTSAPGLGRSDAGLHCQSWP